MLNWKDYAKQRKELVCDMDNKRHEVLANLGVVDLGTGWSVLAQVKVNPHETLGVDLALCKQVDGVIVKIGRGLFFPMAIIPEIVKLFQAAINTD